MAARKTYKKKSRKKKSGSPGIGIFLFAIIILAIILFFSMGKKSDGSSATKEITTKGKVDTKDADVPVVNKEKIAETQVESVLDAIIHAGIQLSVPEDRFRTKVRDEGIYIYVPLNREVVDLNFANMIITGQVEMIGGKLLEGNENTYSNSQLIKFEAKDGQIYFVKLYYDKAKNNKKAKPKLAIVVDDFGEYSGKLLDDFCKRTDKAVTFAIIPHLKHSKDAMYAAEKSGHETIIHAPMEPRSYPKNDPGKKAIFIELSEKEIMNRVNGYIKELPLAIGLNNHMGSMATADEHAMDAVMKVLKKNDMIFFDSWTTSSSVGYRTAQKYQLNTIKRDLFLDDPSATEETIKARLAQLKKMKGKKDKVCVIIHCFNSKRIELLNMFAEGAEDLGFELVPLSEMFKNDLPEIM
jgi:polysaccharide deacetylase 2 family uncharacterized protein YibQ/flagellar basal body-associated protein FliL